MGSNFDWQTDDDQTWESDQPEPPVETSYRRWAIVALAFLLVATVGYLAFRRFNARIEATTAVVEDNVRSSYTLVQTSALRGDTELFDTLLSGRDPAWTQAVRDLAARGLWRDLSPLGLELVREVPDVADVNLTPSLAEAEVAGRAAYVVNIGNGLTETVTLELVDIFRLGQARWLLAPPESDFWQGTTTLNGTRARVIGPTRDEESFLAILQTLESTLADICQRDPGLDCRSDEPITLRLEREPTSLLSLHEPGVHLNASGEVVMPTPTLVGRPIDAAGREALARGYSRAAATAVVAELLGYRCCRQIGFFQALTDWRLKEAGRWAWPLNAADYAQLFRDQWTLDNLRQTFTRTTLNNLSPTEISGIYAAVEFTRFLNPGSSITASQRLLGSSISLSSWLNAVAPITFFNPDRLTVTITPDTQARLTSFLYTRAQFNQEPPPIPYPDATLVASCREASGARLMGYDPVTAQWRFLEQTLEPNIVQVVSLPNNQGLWLVEDVQGQHRVVVWRDGRRELLNGLPTSVIDTAYFGFGSPDGKVIVALPSNDQLFQLGMLNVDACLAGDCNISQLDGFPVWSPDGQHTLLIGSDGQAYLGTSDGVAVRQLGPALGYWGFWADATTFGWTQPATGDSQNMQVVVGQVDSAEIKVLFDTADILTALPDNRLLPRQIAPSVIAVPDEPGHLIVDVTYFGESSNMDYLMLYSTADDNLAQLYAAEANLFLPAFEGDVFSADSQTFIFVQDSNSPTSSLYNSPRLWVYDLAARRPRDYGPVADLYNINWSPDRQWIASAAPSYISLLAPNFGYQALILPPSGVCDFAGWVVGR